MNNLYAFCLLSISITTIAMDVTIGPYQSARDGQVVEKIVSDHYNELAYEALGQPTGTTMKYIESKNYITKVLCVDGNTVGFVNYAAFDVNFCTFHFERRGFIHLIGVDKEHQSKGYGASLLDNALESLQEEQVSSIYLSVKAYNQKAIDLYKKKGFTCPLTIDIPMKDFSLTFRYDTEIPTDYSRGNIIQKHPYLSAAMLGVGAYLYATHFH